MFRTGVLARWSAGGQLELLGRVDRQVRIRGLRADPAEVEAVLAGHPDVARAEVWLPAGGSRLVACLVPRAGRVDLVELRRFARARLPDYLVPGAFAISGGARRTTTGFRSGDWYGDEPVQ